MRNAYFAVVIGLSLTPLARAEPPVAPATAPVNFARDVQPLLAENCFKCHGPDGAERQGGLRLDVRDDSLKPAESGMAAIVPGKAAASELVRRIESTDADELMPPPDSNKKLTAAQKKILADWINAGAKYEQHWAYVAPKRPPVPGSDSTKGADAVAAKRQVVDAFIDEKLKAAKLQPAAAADRATLIRRLSFDLLGLPPTPAEVEAFVNDASPDAYEKLVERLLASPHFGERMALYWLDLVRYADSAGYHSDNERDVWMYRDWVIRAFNENMPFDEFTRQQLAGDLITNVTDASRIASGYNRLLMTTEEGGAQAKEYAAKYAADRVRNASSVWLAGTLGCAECHDHKYDPFTTRDFYRFAAFFADVKENAVGRQQQTQFPTAEQREKLKQLDEQVAAAQAELDNPSSQILGQLPADQAEWEKELATSEKKAEREKLPKPVLAAFKVEEEKRTDKHRETLAAHYRTIAPALQPLREALAAATKERDTYSKQVPSSLVSSMAAPRTVRILPRGNWLDDSGEAVQSGTPAFLPAAMTANGKDETAEKSPARATRLDLANWLTARENPLVARVMVNRLWALLFGQGLVKSLEDFGTQGAQPTHAELLDWLAIEFIDSGWDVKHMIRLMANSDAYRRTSIPTAEQKRLDPGNVLLARQNRFRLEAEKVRDNALAISGLLMPTIGGPSVKPYQPPGYWQYLNFPKREYKNDDGERQYRRGLYTHWQRTFLHPSLLAFDASTREECCSQRTRSNTPQQALTLLNDPTYVEAARALAERLIRDGGSSPQERVALAWKLATGRAPTAEETALVVGIVEKNLAVYRADSAAADKLLAIGQRGVPEGIDRAELAAWSAAGRVVLNLHERVTRN